MDEFPFLVWFLLSFLPCVVNLHQIFFLFFLLILFVTMLFVKGSVFNWSHADLFGEIWSLENAAGTEIVLNQPFLREKCGKASQPAPAFCQWKKGSAQWFCVG